MKHLSLVLMVLLASGCLLFGQGLPLVITTEVLPDGAVGEPYSFQMRASGGYTPYANWRVVEGNLPSGLSLNSSTGVISGTPTRVGSGAAQIAVSDNMNQSASSVFDWTILARPLSITTTSLPNGTVGVFYSHTLTAVGGTPGYRNWTVRGGALPSGLGLNASNGVVSGIPLVGGSGSVEISVDDSVGQTARSVIAWTILAGPLSITTSALPGGTVGVPYSFTVAATGGTPPYRNWRVVGGTLPPGLTLDATSGTISGTPTTAGSGSVVVEASDSGNQTASKSLNWTVIAALTITTTSLPAGTVGVAYSQTLAATGGTPPYTWARFSGVLPPGLTLNVTTGVINGTPTVGGSYTYAVFVTDAASPSASVTKQFTITVSVASPAISISDIPASPGQQPSFNVQLGSAYSLDMSGTLTLTFAPDSGLPNDPMIVFSNGTRRLDFTIKAGSMVSSASLQTGTVAGRIDLTITSLVAAGQSIMPTPAPTRSVQIARAAPKINSVQIVRTGGGFNVLVTGYSTSRQVTQATFSFTGASSGNLQTSQLTVPVDSAFTTWYGGTASGQFGSAFLYTQPFQVSGDMSAIATVSVTLSNATGSSSPVSATF